jgi:hypothetical protein
MLGMTLSGCRALGHILRIARRAQRRIVREARTILAHCSGAHGVDSHTGPAASPNERDASDHPDRIQSWLGNRGHYTTNAVWPPMCRRSIMWRYCSPQYSGGRRLSSIDEDVSPGDV